MPTYDSTSAGANHISVSVILNTGDNFLQFAGTPSATAKESRSIITLISSYNSPKLIASKTSHSYAISTSTEES